ncbi:hypothetical protein M877_05395 [Streptomyces niveus NCIMB 11891]|nr:hypothetical protein M877_05395 [Streptomyces niveus NCIMB 11891]
MPILVGINDVGRHTYDPDGHVVSAEEFAAAWLRLVD